MIKVGLISCCRFTGPVHIIYKIEAEKFTGRKVSRIEFREATGLQDRFFLELPLTLSDSARLCRQHTAYINVWPTVISE